MNPIRESSFEAIELHLKKEKKSLGDRLLLLAVFLAASVYLPLSLGLPLTAQASDGLALLISALSVLAMARLSRRIGTGVGHAILLFLIGSLTGGPFLAAAVGALISVACIFCWFAVSAPSPILVILPAVAYLSASLSVGSPFLGALALAGMPAALLLTVALRGLFPKIRAICLIALGIGGAAALAAVLYVLLTQNEISVSLLREGVDSFRELLTVELDARLLLLEEDVGLIPAGMAREDYARSLANDFINHLPAILILLFSGIALAIHSTMIRILLAQKAPKEHLAPAALFDMSALSAVIFLVSLFLSLVLTDPASGPARAVCENLYLILIPGMLITLWMVLNAWFFSKKPSCGGMLLWLAIPLLFLSFSSALLPIGAVAGAVLVLVGRIRKALRQKKS